MTGKDVDLRVEHNLVGGRIGGAVAGFDATGSIDLKAFAVRLGGANFGRTLSLEFSPYQIQGRLGGPRIGFDVRFEQAQGKLWGRIGGGFDGKDIEVQTLAPVQIVALTAVIAYNVLQENWRAAANSSR